MKYSLQCKYSMINQMFLFVLKSMDENVDYSFEWQIKSIDNPVWVLTNNNIVIKAETINDLVQFHVVSSDEKLHEKNIYTSTVPILTFETQQEDLEIIYDFLQMPSKSDKIVAEIISQVINAYGGGFLTEQSEYTLLENNIKDVLKKHELLKKEDEQIQIEIQDQNEQIAEQSTVEEIKPKKTRTKKVEKQSTKKETVESVESESKEVKPKRTRTKKTAQKGE